MSMCSSSGVQTPNCIRQTVFDAVALDYEKITVLIDATAAARPEIHLCEYSCSINPLYINLYVKTIFMLFWHFNVLRITILLDIFISHKNEKLAF